MSDNNIDYSQDITGKAENVVGQLTQGVNTLCTQLGEHVHAMLGFNTESEDGQLLQGIDRLSTQLGECVNALIGLSDNFGAIKELTVSTSELNTSVMFANISLKEGMAEARNLAGLLYSVIHNLGVTFSNSIYQWTVGLGKKITRLNTRIETLTNKLSSLPTSGDSSSSSNTNSVSSSANHGFPEAGGLWELFDIDTVSDLLLAVPNSKINAAGFWGKLMSWEERLYKKTDTELIVPYIEKKGMQMPRTYTERNMARMTYGVEEKIIPWFKSFDATTIPGIRHLDLKTDNSNTVQDSIKSTLKMVQDPNFDTASKLREMHNNEMSEYWKTSASAFSGMPPKSITPEHLLPKAKDKQSLGKPKKVNDTNTISNNLNTANFSPSAPSYRVNTGTTNHIRIEKLVEKIEIHTTQLSESVGDIKELVTQTLIDAVNDIQYA